MSDFQMFQTPQGNQAVGNTVASQSCQVEVVALHMQETGTYNDMYQRDYVGHLGHDDVNGLLTTMARNNMNTRGNAFSNIASSVIDLDSRNPTGILIPNGWGAKRFRFILQTRERSALFPNTVFYTYIQGFSESMDVSLQTQQLNPNMTFFINNFIRIQEIQVNTAQGPRLQHRVQQSGQLINGILVANQNPGGIAHFLRPVDVLSRVQVMNDAELMSADVTDLRGSSLAGSQSVMSSFGNSTPTTYLSRLLTPIVDAVNQVNYVQGVGNTVDRVVGNAYGNEPTVESMPFLSLLERRLNRPGGATFTMSELAQIDPTVGSRTNVRPVSTQYASALTSRDNSSYWNNAEPETLFAAKLVTSIPALLWSNYIGFASFTFTNAVGGNRVEVKMHQINPITIYTPPEVLNRFMVDLEDVIARDASYNNQIQFTCDVNVSILSDIHMQVSLNGGPKIPYVAPVFTSGVLNPIYTHNHDNFEKFATAMHRVTQGVESISREVSSSISNLNTNI